MKYTKILENNNFWHIYEVKNDCWMILQKKITKFERDEREILKIITNKALYSLFLDNARRTRSTSIIAQHMLASAFLCFTPNFFFISENNKRERERRKRELRNTSTINTKYFFFEKELSRKIFSTIKAMINEPHCCWVFFLAHNTPFSSSLFYYYDMLIAVNLIDERGV